MMEEDNLMYLVKGYSDEEETDIVLTDEATIYFNKILQEYSVLTSNKEGLLNLRMRSNIAILEYERDVLVNIINIYNETKEISVLSALSSLDFGIDPSKNPKKLLEAVINRIKGLNNKIRINKIKYTKRFKDSKESVKRNLEKEALLLEINLKLGREINTRTTSVSKWINMLNLSSEMANDIKKSIQR